MKITRRRVYFILFATALAAVFVYAFKPKPIEVDVAPVVRGPLRITVDAEGKTRIKERYVVSAPLAGRLKRITLDAGDAVEAGKTILACVEPKDPELLDARSRAEAEARVQAAQAALQRAASTLQRTAAELELAQAEHQRLRQMPMQSSASQKELDDAALMEKIKTQEHKASKFSEEIARFELEQAQAVLLHTASASWTNPSTSGASFAITSPCSGRVLRVFQESSAVVAAGTPLLEIGDPSDLQIVIDVLSTDAVKIKPGAMILLEQWGGDQPLHASVRLVEPAAFTKISALGVEEQRVNVIADFVDPPEKRPALGDAYRVEARIIIWEEENVLKIPTSALFRHNQEWAVFMVNKNHAALRPASIGRLNGLEAQVLSGLGESDRVLLHPTDRINDGIAVVPR